MLEVSFAVWTFGVVCGLLINITFMLKSYESLQEYCYSLEDKLIGDAFDEEAGLPDGPFDLREFEDNVRTLNRIVEQPSAQKTKQFPWFGWGQK